MATLSADNFTKQANPTSDNILSPGTLGGRVRVLTDEITLAAASVNDLVQIGRKLRAGAIIVGITVQHAALGGTTTFRLGDANDDDRYMTDIASAAAATRRDLNIAGNQYKIGTNTDDDTILFKVQVAAMTGLVRFNIFYTED